MAPDPSRPTPEVEAIRALLAAEVTALLQSPAGSLDVDSPLQACGVDSMGAAALAERLGQRLGRRISPTIFWRYSTIAALAAHLGEGERAEGVKGVDRAVHAPSETIAIVGMACRFPGGADTPERFFRMVREGVDAVTEIPAERWDIEAYHDPTGTRRGSMRSRRMGTIARSAVEGFDAAFFGISAREAEQMDPQQRLMLELSWEALEDAGIDPTSLAGTETGVFAGAIMDDYSTLRRRLGDAGVNAYTSTGQARSIVANRVSYLLGLRGPSMTVDTACSSSIVSVHLACQALRTGECDLALAGGVQLNLAPETSTEVSAFGALSPDGECRTFDSRANGYVRGEGGGVALLKTLSRALRDGDRVYALIRGSAVNNDGRSNGLTAPSGEAQEAVIRAACRRAGVSPREVDYVELHGTGTALGDPIEAEALGAVYGRDRGASRPLLVGSVKTNIGHLEGAAGIAGILKAALSLHRREIGPSLHFEQVNPHIDPEALGLRVVTRAEPLRGDEERPARAGVSSFGFGGTNAHAILEAFVEPEAHLLALSAESEPGLRSAALEALARLDEATSDVDAVCAEMALGSRGRARLAIAAASREELCASLGAYLAGRDGGDAVMTGAATEAAVRPVLVCSGLGSQWFGMGRRLLATEPAFRSAFERVDAAFAASAGWSLLDALYAPRGVSRQDDGDAHDLVHPLLVAQQMAMGELLRSFGVEAGAVVGQSIGEVASAFCAGALDVATAARVIQRIGEGYRRMTLRGGGLLALVACSREELARRGGSLDGPVFLAGDNDPETCVVSGEEARVTSALTGLKVRAITRAIAHAPPVAAEMPTLIAGLPSYAPAPVEAPLFSTTLGRFARGEEIDAAYWAANMTRPVLFRQGIEAMIDAGHRVFVELSPHPVLLRSIERIAAERRVSLAAIGAQDRVQDGRRALLRALGAMHVAGVDLAWDRVLRREAGRSEARAMILPLSARSEGALRDLAVAYGERVRSSACAEEVCAATALRRPRHAHRVAFVGRGRADLASQLDAFAAGRGSADRGAAASRPVLVFSGQGGQWRGMGRRLMREEPVFRASFERAARAIEDASGPSLLAEIEAPTPSVWEDVDFVQPAIFAMQVALADLFGAWGIAPAAVVGHSMGEVAAAHVAGVLRIEDAARIITARSALARQHADGRGGMAAVQLSGAETIEALRRFDGLEIAASNAPRSQVVAGDEGALTALLAELSARGVWCRRVQVSFASHSAHVDAALPELERSLRGVRPLPARAPFFSTARCEELRGEEMDARYWCENLRREVRFSEAIQRLAGAGHRSFVEISPHPILTQAIEENLEAAGADGRAIPSLTRDADEACAARRVIGALHAAGAEIRWPAVHPAGARHVALPSYPWQRRRFWIDGADRLANKDDRPRETPGSRLRAARPDERGALLTEVLRACARRTLSLPSDARLGDGDSLFELGLDSLLAIDLAREIAGDTGAPCTSSLLFRHPTVSGIRAAIARSLGWDAAPEIVMPPAAEAWIARPRPVRAPAVHLVCFPYSGAGASLFRSWPDALPPDVDVCAIRPPGREARAAEPACSSIAELVSGVMPHLATLRDRPIALCGYSFGAVVAFEVARAMRAAGMPAPAALFVAASPAPDCLVRRDDPELDDAALIDFLRRGGVASTDVLDDPELCAVILRTMRVDLRMHAEYRCGVTPPLDCPIVAYAAAEDAEAPLVLVKRWARHTRGRFALRTMPGRHFFVHSHPAAFFGELARDLTTFARTAPITQGHTA